MSGETLTSARIGIRPSTDRTRVVILFGGDEECEYYASVEPQQALRIAKNMADVANAVLQIKSEVTH